VEEHQLLNILRQMREYKSFVYYLCERDSVRNLLPTLQSKFELASKALSQFLEHQRRNFPRLYFVEDKDIIEMQYACVNNPSSLRYYLPLIFEVADLSWREEKPSQDGEEERGDPRMQQVQVPTGGPEAPAGRKAVGGPDPARPLDGGYHPADRTEEGSRMSRSAHRVEERCNVRSWPWRCSRLIRHPLLEV